MCVFMCLNVYLCVSEVHCYVFVSISTQISEGIDMSMSCCGVIWGGVLGGGLFFLWIICEL